MSDFFSAKISKTQSLSGSRVTQLVMKMSRVIFAIVLLALLWQLVDGEQAIQLIVSANPLWLALAALALAVQIVFSALRWRLTASQLGVTLDKRTSIKEYFLSQAVNQTLPGGVIGDAARAFRSRSQAGLVASGQAVFLERMAGLVALVAVMFLAFAITAGFGIIDWPGWLLLALALFFALTVLLIGAFWVVGKTSKGNVQKGIFSIVSATKVSLLAPSVRWTQLSLSLAIVISNIAGFTFVAWAIGSDLSFVASLALVPLILLAMLVPLTISGWGIRESAAVILFPMVGLAGVEGLAASFAFGLVSLAVSAPGVIFALSTGKKRESENLRANSE